MPNSANRVLILGIDGATPEKLLVPARQGRLPHIGRLLDRGCFGRMRSTIPPISAPAWVSLMTGVHPAKHGICTFVRRRAELSPRFRPEIARSSDIGCPAIWDYCERAQKRLVLVNVPVTYPPPRIDGAVVSGFEAPWGQGETFHPPELRERIARELGRAYRSDYDLVRNVDGNAEACLEGYLQVEEERTRAARLLLREVPSDVFMIVFTITDRVQHLFWGDDHVIDRVYEQVDRCVGELLAEVDERTLVLLVSDHGAGAFDGEFFTNRWLAAEGFLTFKGPIAGLATSRSLAIKRVRADRLLARLGVGPVGRHLVPSLARRAVPVPYLKRRSPACVNWSRTVAYGSNYGIYVNRRGREPFGIVSEENYDGVRDDIIKRLLTLRGSNGDARLVAYAGRREEVSEGPYLDELPDIIFTLNNEGYVPSNSYAARTVFGAPKLKGTHTMWGVFGIAGAGIKQHLELQDISIVDVLPTVLCWLGVAIPAGLDGRVLLESFEEDRREQHVTQMVGAPQATDWKASLRRKVEDYSEVENRLRALGYLE